VSPIEAKLKTFGWYTVTVDGHNTREILDSINRLKKIAGKPKAIIANTIKGKGVSFMEHPKAIVEGGGRYRWHDGIPDEEEYALALHEIISRIRRKIEKCKTRIEFPVLVKHPVQESPFKGSSLLNAFSESLVELGDKHKDLVVLDADLAESCGLRKFQEIFPQRFIEVGIAEQDMVSTAGGLALAGKLPIVNTYAAFLTSRANEQIFNNASEGSKIIYVGHLAGILPAKPGKSHMGIRDISLLKAIPNMIICQPSNALELKKIFNFLVFDASQSSYLRLEHFAPRKDVQLPENYEVKLGGGTVLAYGKDAAIVGYGPLLLSEALLAREELKKEGIEIKVVNLPWLNNIDGKWLMKVVGDVRIVICLENHAVFGGQSEEITRIVSDSSKGIRVYTLGIEGYGRSGDGAEILSYYGIDSSNIAKKIKRWFK
jgi:transketolase